MTENENNEDQEIAEADQPEPGANAEAAKYRRRLRKAEAERDQLAKQVRALRRSEVERQVADRLDDPSDLWRADGVDLAELLDQDGAIEQAKVDEVAATVTAEHPAWAKRPEVSGIDEDQGKSSDRSVGASWAGLLRSGNRER